MNVWFTRGVQLHFLGTGFCFYNDCGRIFQLTPDENDDFHISTTRHFLATIMVLSNSIAWPLSPLTYLFTKKSFGKLEYIEKLKD